MSNPHYNAFISYRRTPHDTAVAIEIQHSLERFRVPREIRRAGGPERIDRIFRDQEELEITSNLSKRIEDALSASDYLIVICSPGYLQSRWCLHEVESFLKTHERSHVLCVLSEGEPPDVFPDALRRYEEQVTLEDGTAVTRELETEPLACDYRGNVRAARRTELPRLAAVLLGCRYDELILRWEKYRRRRLTAILGSAFLLASAAAFWLLWSNAQISRNYRQALINESKLLAEQSMESYDSRDRLHAIRSALQALVGDVSDRPVTDEAQFALAQATYAYAAPWACLETWRVDLADDVTDYMLCRDGSVLVCMDRTGRFWSYNFNTREALCSFLASENDVPSSPIENTDGELLCYAEGCVISLNCQTGSENWRIPLKYQALGTLARSPDGTLIAAADSFAVQIMSQQGEPVLSLPLPLDTNEYITDLSWSPDGKRIAVKLRDPDTSLYRVGLFDVTDSSFSGLSSACRCLDLFLFDPDGILYLLCDDRENNTDYSYKTSQFTTLSPVSFELLAFRGEDLIWSQHFTASSIFSDHFDMLISAAQEKQLYLPLGGSIYVISDTGKLIGSYETGSSVLRVLSVYPDTLEFVTQSGELGTLTLSSGECFRVPAFPQNTDQVTSLAARSRTDNSFLVSVGGNLELYETLYDETLSFFSGDALPSYPDGSLLCGDRLLVMADRNLLFYDLTDRSLFRVVPLDDTRAYHLLNAADDSAWLLEIDGKTGAFSVLCFDFRTGDVLWADPLAAYDYFTRNQLLTAPLSASDSIYLDYVYSAPSSFAVNGDMLWFHDRDNCNKLQIFSLSERSLTTLDLSSSLGDREFLLFEEDSFLLASPLMVSPNGKTVFTTCTDLESGECAAMLVSSDTGEIIHLSGSPSDLHAVALTDETVVYAGVRELYLYRLDGTLLRCLPYRDDTPLAFSFHDGLLYAVFPDHTLRIYREGEEVRSVPLSFDLSFRVIRGNAFRFEFTSSRLYLYCGTSMNVISLNEDSSTAVYYAGSVLTRLAPSSELLVFCRNPALTDSSGDYGTYLASWHEYSVDELILRAQEQLQSFSSLTG